MYQPAAGVVLEREAEGDTGANAKTPERAGIDVRKAIPRLEHLRAHTDVEELSAALDTELAIDHSGGNQTS